MLILNGELLEKDKADLLALDKGLLLGIGLFETMRLVKGQILALDLHWQRLNKSADILELRLPLTYDLLKAEVNRLIDSCQLDNAGFRLTITHGVGPRGLLSAIEQKGCYILESFERPNYNNSYRMCWSSILANPSDPSASIKSLSYLTHVFVKREATKLGFDDALQLTKDDFITESSSANFFMVKDGGLLTAPLGDGVLAGITRQRIIEYCRLENILFCERSIHKDEVIEAEDVFLCNALMGIKPIACIESNNFQPSLLTKRLMRQIN